MRNPDWMRDEIILALDLYFNPERGSIDDKNPKVIELSKILKKLPLIQNRPDEETFRNPSGVSLKLSNFLPHDPAYKGKGMKRGSKLDGIIFHEFNNDRENLKAIADKIKKIASNEQLKAKINNLGNGNGTSDYIASEGQILYKYHKVIERDKKIVKKKKEEFIHANGRIFCEACLFSFEEYYGEVGIGFIECHHKTPLSRVKIESKTTLDDLALVCSNCHRMLHKKIDVLSVEDLKMLIKYSRIVPNE